MQELAGMAAALGEYARQVGRTVQESGFDTLARVAQALLEAHRRGGIVYLAGNGGSAATASHMANDLLKGCRVGEAPGLRALALCDPAPVLTCLGNDFCYDEVFSLQLETLARPGDVAVLFSGSGNSKNILRAAEAAARLGLTVIGFTGQGGGALAPLCTIAVHAPTGSMEQLEDMHLIYEHALVCLLRQELAAAPR